MEALLDGDPDEILPNESIETDVELKLHILGTKQLWTQKFGFHWLCNGQQLSCAI